jgi:hypothetical protein
MHSAIIKSVLNFSKEAADIFKKVTYKICERKSFLIIAYVKAVLFESIVQVNGLIVYFLIFIWNL